MVISEEPTYAATLPEAMVETITLGTQMGRARMARVIMAVPPDPPTPSKPPRSSRVLTKHSNASVIAAIAPPRSPQKTAFAPCGWWAAISAADTCRGAADDGGAGTAAGVFVDKSATVTGSPAASSNAETYSASSSLVSRVAATQARFCAGMRSTPRGKLPSPRGLFNRERNVRFGLLGYSAGTWLAVSVAVAGMGW